MRITYPTTDITIIYLTASLVPQKFAEFQRKILVDAINGAPIISVSREPLKFGENILDDGQKSTDNIYRQIYRAAQHVKTKYIALAEDDVLYSEDHFIFCRPPDDTFAYNQNRLALFTWGRPMFNWRNRKSNCSLIAPTALLLESLHERFTKWPNPIPEKIVGELGRNRVEKNLGVTQRKSIEVFSEVSIIQFNHDAASENAQRAHRKRPGPIRAYDIFYWGKAEDLVKKYT
jgi:hypothetical protein